MHLGLAARVTLLVLDGHTPKSRAAVLSQDSFVPPGDIWQCLETCQNWKGLGATGLSLVEATDDAKHSKMDNFPQQRTISLQIKIVPLLKNPTTGVGWLLADLEGPPLGQLGNLAMSTVSYPPAGCRGHVVIVMAKEQEQAELHKAFHSLSLELAHHHFCHILLAKVSHKQGLPTSKQCGS